jgi:hypothetical protein
MQREEKNAAPCRRAYHLREQREQHLLEELGRLEALLIPSDSITDTRLMTVGEVASLASTNRLNLQPEFQRRKVWPKPAKSYLIDTLMHGLPMPEIFAYKEKGGAIAVIDGQQRLSTILDFVNVNLHAWTGGKILNFEDLEQDQRDTFLSYRVVFRVINSWDPIVVKDIFVRLNRHVVPLNAQEMRHARAEAQIVKLAEELSDDAFWRTSGLTERSQKRMKDVEFVLRLLLSMKDGPVGTGGPEIDRVIESLSPSDIPRIDAEYRKTLALAKEIFRTQWKFAAKFGQRDFYPLFIALHSLAGIKVTQAEAERAKESLFDLKSQAFSKKPTGLAMQYFQACYGGGISNIRTRAEILLQVVKKALRH